MSRNKPPKKGFFLRILPIAASAVGHIFQPHPRNSPQSFLNKNRCCICHSLRKLDISNLAYFLMILCDLSVVFAHLAIFRISWFCSIYMFIFVNISYLHILHLVHCSDLWPKTCPNVICTVLTYLVSVVVSFSCILNNVRL